VTDTGSIKVADVTDNSGVQHLGAAYQQLCASYHAVDDFRTKLLGFLPLVTGGGLILLTGRPDEVRQEFFWPFGLFGIAITTGLLTYELYGIRSCKALVTYGRLLEWKMGLSYGQFIGRPQVKFSLVSKSVAAALIYSTVLAAWTYLALLYEQPSRSKVVGAAVFCVAFMVIVLHDLFVRMKERSRLKQLLASPTKPISIEVAGADDKGVGDGAARAP
jgi:hypothetical protein